MINNQVKISILQQRKKEKTGITLRITKKNFQEESSHELFLTTIQKIGNAFVNNVSTHNKLGKAQLSKIIQSVGFLSAFFGKFIQSLTKTPVSLDKNVLAPSAIMTSAADIDGAIQRKVCGWGIIIAGKEMNLVISSE